MKTETDIYIENILVSMKFRNRGYIMSIFTFMGFIITSLLFNYKRIIVSIGMVLSGFVLWFHRNPHRTPASKAKYVAPVDGRVDQIRHESGETIVSIYLGITDVHSIRSPTVGQVTKTLRKSGKNYPAQLTTLAEKNNSLSYVYENEDVLTVYTGIFARRLVDDTSPPESVNKGQEVGFISFGSRCTVRIKNKNFDTLEVSEGDFIRSGESVVAN